MRHYEIVLLIHPDQSEQTPAMIQRYQTFIENGAGKIHRIEDWGRRQLAYPIKKIHKASYLLFNIECSDALLRELTNNFRFNDAILRHLVLHLDEAITTPSPMLKAKVETPVTKEATPMPPAEAPSKEVISSEKASEAAIPAAAGAEETK